MNISLTWPIHAQSENDISSRGEWSKESVQSSPEYIEGKAAASLARGGYTHST
ncbi:MAG: hypothetical protein VST68_07295 [Nitrospirota bacterium]|nr:hypothetical protein [Nitrospirota bacterium]